MGTLDTIRAISDDSRARIIHLLSLGTFNVQDLTGALAISQSTISHHLKNLQSAGLVRARKEGTWSYYALETEHDQGKLAQELCARIAAETGAQFEADSRKAQEILNRRRDNTKQFFDSIAGSWHEMRKEAHGNISFIEELAAGISKDGAVLELGCGSGALLERILPRSGATLGVDSSQVMIDEARKNLKAKGLQADLRLGYLEHLPVGDESVDRTVAYMVFHHVAELHRALSDALRVLKPGGEILIVERADYDSAAMRERFGDLWFDFTAEEFSAAVKKAGYVAVQTRELGPKGEAFWLSAHRSRDLV